MQVSKEERDQIENTIEKLKIRLNELNERVPNGARKEKEKLTKAIDNEKQKLEEKVRIKKETEKLSPEEKQRKKAEHAQQMAVAKMQQLGIKKMIK